MPSAIFCQSSARACHQFSQISPAVRWMAARKLRAAERVNDFDTSGIGIQAWIFSVDAGGLIQAAVGLSGGVGGLLTKRSGLLRNARSSVF